MFWKKKSQDKQHFQRIIDLEIMYNDKIDALKEKYENKITELEGQLKDQLEVNQKYIQDLHDSKIYESTYKDSYNTIKQQMDKQIYLCTKQMDDSIQKDKILESLESSLAAVCEERVNENVELFALKTYRGWKCLYVNGEKINTDGIESIYIRDEDRISVEINR